MAPRTTRAATTKKAAPVANGASAAPTASKKRKAAEADAEIKAAPTKKTKAKDFDVKDLDAAISDIDTAKKPKKTAATKATKAKAPRPAPKRAAAAPPAFDIAPTSTLSDFKASPPRASSLPVINSAPTEVLTIYVFGTGDMSGDLGLGPKKKTAKLPTIIPELDGSKEGAYRVVQLSCGGMHTVALTEDSKIVTWGGNDEGALGRDSTWEGGLRDMDAEPEDDAASDDSDDEALNPIESTPTHIPESSFPPGTRFTCVAAGDSCSFAVTDTGLVYGWGTFADSEANKTFLYYKGEHIEKQEKPMLMPGLKNIKTVVCGSNHALALDHDGRVWSWGVSEKLQVGRRLRPENDHKDNFYPGVLGLTRYPIKQLSAGPYHSLALDTKDRVFAWGMNNYGQAGYTKNSGADDAQLPYPLEIRTLSRRGIVTLAAGARQSAAVTSDGRCLVWGMVGEWNGFKLTQEQIDDPKVVFKTESGKPGIILQPLEVPGIGEVTHVACSATHIIFINKAGKAFASGYGEEGQLGNKEKEDNKIAAPVMRLDNVKLTWAGTGGQWSMVGAPATAAQTNGTKKH
ncbi:unnamed protein product [Discula destructiva]